MEGHPLDVAAMRAERVDIRVAQPPPVAKLDPQLERRPRRADELILVDAEHPVIVEQRRDRRLAHPDRADLLGFDQSHRDAALDQPRHRGGGHPSRRSPADDDDPGDAGRAGIRHAAARAPK
jgi:hypothetical protein